MNDFYIVNEVSPGHDPRQPGAMYVFSSRSAVERYYEPWYVNEGYILLRGDGRRMVLTERNGRVIMADSPDDTDYSDLLRTLVIHDLNSVESAIQKKKRHTSVGKIDFGQFTTDTLTKLALLLMDP